MSERKLDIILHHVLDNETETEHGEKQFWIYLKSGRTIEITYECYGLKEEDQFVSVRYHCLDGEFDSYDLTMGVIEAYCVSDKPFPKMFEQAIVKAMQIIAKNMEELAD